MSETKHSPRPWKFHAAGSVWSEQGTKLRIVCDTSGAAIPWACQTSPEEAVANGNLIGAAPELLEALEALDTYVFCLIEHIATGSGPEEIKEYITTRRGIVTAARAAIAKAKGEA